MKLCFMLAISLFLAGCVSYAPSIPEGYTGDIATIDDSFERQGRSKANIFYIRLIDGKPIHNSFNASYGDGPRLITMGASRDIPTRPLNLYVVGQLHHAAPIGAMLNAGSNYIVEGDLNFVPEKNAMYVVSGHLSEAYSAVWIEDISGNIVSKRIELKSPDYDSTVAQDEKRERHAVTREELFLNLASGESRSLIAAKLGELDSISRYDGNSFLEKPPNVIYQYSNLGSIQFSARNSEAQFVERVIPSVKLPNSISSIKLQLGTEGQTLQRVAESYHQFTDLEINILDLLAEKIWTGRGAEDAYTVDALSWLCKALAKSKNSRYRSLLQNVANEASENKLRKYAISSLGFLPTTETEQFIPIGK